MNAYCRALVAGVAAVCLGGAAQAEEGAAFDDGNDGVTAAYSDSFALGAGYYQTRPAAAAPRPVYSSAPRIGADQPLGYVPPGLSIATPGGIYAPFYGGWSPYSMPDIGGYDGYRMMPGY